MAMFSFDGQVFYFDGEVFFTTFKFFFQTGGIFTLWLNISVFSKEFVIVSKKKRVQKRKLFCPIKPLIPADHINTDSTGNESGCF